MIKYAKNKHFYSADFDFFSQKVTKFKIYRKIYAKQYIF